MSGKDATISTYASVPGEDAEINIINNTDNEAKKNAKYDLLGFFFGFAGSAANTVAFACVQGLKGQVPPLQLYVMRSAVLWVAVIILFAARRKLPRVERKDVPYVGIYALLVTTYNFTFYTAVTQIPLGVTGSLVRIIAMFLALPLARVFLGETITILKVLGVVVGSIGLVLICKPEMFFNFPSSQSNSLENTHEITPNLSSIFNTTIQTDYLGNSNSSETPKYEYVGYICAALSALNSVTHNIVQRRKLPRTETPILCFWLGPCGIVIGTIFSIIFEDVTLPVDIQSWLLISAHCFCGLVSVVCNIQAQKIATVVVAQLALSLQICFYFLGQYFFLQTVFPTEGTWLEILGTVLIATSVTLVPAAQFVASFKR